MKCNDHYYIEGITLADKINIIGEKLGIIRDRLDDIAYEMCKEDLMKS